jgi:Tol biopolymer transport system component
MKTKINTLLGAGLCLLVTFGLTPSAAAQTATPDRIVFNSLAVTGGTPKHPTYTPSIIYSMKPDGSDLRQLTSASVDSSMPAWSSDHNYILFNRGDVLYVMRADGELNGAPMFAVGPARPRAAWSPDGKTILFTELIDSTTSGYGLWSVDVDPPTGQVGTPILIRGPHCLHPHFSPDGTRIAFVLGGQSPQIVTVRDLLTGTEYPIGSPLGNVPSWSPDGNLIALGQLVTESIKKGNKTVTNNYYEIFVANADGSGKTQVTNLKGISVVPSWSPDGKELVFQSNISGANSIYKVSLVTGAVTLLCSGAEHPMWAR